MEELFTQSVKDLGSMYHFSRDELEILDDADKAAEELSKSEFEHYIKREVNRYFIKPLPSFSNTPCIRNVPLRLPIPTSTAIENSLSPILLKSLESGMHFDTISVSEKKFSESVILAFMCSFPEKLTLILHQ